MKRMYILLLLQMGLTTLLAQSPPQTINVCTNFCSRDLSDTITGLTINSTPIKYFKPVGSSCVTVSNFDVQYKENSCPATPHIDTCTDDLSALVMRVYYPVNNDYTACPRPAIIIFHGGAYAECSSYNNGDVVALSKKLASRGYVVFDVNYRVGVITDNRKVNVMSESNKDLTFTSAQQLLAIYRALQGARGAIRSVLQMQIDSVNKDKYIIKTDKIFLAGLSAGSLIAMSAEYYGFGTAGQAKVDALFPNVSAVLGPIDQKGVYYADPPAAIADDYFRKVKGILNCWGSLFIPTSYESHPYDFFAGQGYSLPPIISFHGVKDTVFDYMKQGVYFSRNTLYRGVYNDTESRCLASTYTTPANNMNPPTKYETGIGSQTIYNMLHNPGAGITPITTELYLDCDAFHGLDDDCATCTYKSDFGTLATNQDATYDYIAGRAATFFQTILGSGTANITTSRFIECVNDRVTCTGTTTTSCSDSDGCN